MCFWSIGYPDVHSAKSTTVLLSTAVVARALRGTGTGSTIALLVPVPHSARPTTAVLSSTVVDFALCSFHAKLHIA